MPTRRLYRDDPYLLEFDARVLARLDHEGRPAVVLDETAFYAESGGQPWDLGTLDAVPVLAVVEKGDEIVHVLEGPLPADRVHGIVDGARRRDHRQQHHGQHLFSRALLEVAGARTVSFHLGARGLHHRPRPRGVGGAGGERAPAHERGDLGGPARARADDDPGRGRGPRRRRPRGSRRRGAPRRGRGLRPAALRRHPPTLHGRGRLRARSWDRSATREAAASASSAATAPSRRRASRDASWTGSWASSLRPAPSCPRPCSGSSTRPWLPGRRWPASWSARSASRPAALRGSRGGPSRGDGPTSTTLRLPDD